MILGHDEIKRELKAGSLIVGLAGDPPFDDDQVRESSLDLPIGNEFLRWKKPDELERDPGIAIEDRRVVLSHPSKELADKLQQVTSAFTEKSVLAPDGFFPLQPGEFVLTQVAQYTGLPDYLAGRVEGRTRFARIGLEVHSTAPTIRAGWAGRITLELKNVGPLIVLLTPGDKICQLILERVLTPPSLKLESQY